MSNLYSVHFGTMEFVDGAVVAYKLSIDRQKLARLIRAATQNKTGKSKRGCFRIEAKIVAADNAPHTEEPS